MAMGKVLVADDDKNICELLRLYLVKEGFQVVLAGDGEEALARFSAENPDIILLDVMMPRLDGWQVCREIRKKSECPIIMITAKGETFDKVLGLELGADDYVVKPFETKEIVARIKAVLRRTGKSAAENDIKEVSYDKLVVNMTKYELKVDGKVVDTPPKELELLYHLASNPNRVYTRDQLLDEVWGFEYYGDSRTVDVHVKRLREKLEGVSDKWTLKTVWGVGYKFEVKEKSFTEGLFRGNRCLLGAGCRGFLFRKDGLFDAEKFIYQIFYHLYRYDFGEHHGAGRFADGICVSIFSQRQAEGAGPVCKPGGSFDINRLSKE